MADLMDPWDFIFEQKGTRECFRFGNELTAVPEKSPKDLVVEISVLRPKASTVVAAAGIIAKTQRDCYPGEIGPFDIASALSEVAYASTLPAIAHIAARLEHAWQALLLELEHAKYGP